MIIILISFRSAHRPTCRHVQSTQNGLHISSNEMVGKRTSVHVFATFNVCICAKVHWGEGAGPTATPVYAQIACTSCFQYTAKFDKEKQYYITEPRGPLDFCCHEYVLLDNNSAVLAAVTGTTFSKIELGARVTGWYKRNADGIRMCFYFLV